jgi:hypothetical protein
LYHSTSTSDSFARSFDSFDVILILFKGAKTFFNFYCCTCIFDNVQIPFTKKYTLYYKYKMLKLSLKIYLYGLLHVSVHPDHHQGAYVEPC